MKLINAKELKTKVTRQNIIDYLEEYIMEHVKKAAFEGRTSFCYSGYNVSHNPDTSEIKRGLITGWIWHSAIEYPEIEKDFNLAGYTVEHTGYYGNTRTISW